MAGAKILKKSQDQPLAWKVGVSPRNVLTRVSPIVSILAVVLAAPNANAASCDGIETVAISCGGGQSSGNPIWDLLLMAINILSAGVGIVAVGGIAWAALQWTTAGGEPSKVQAAKSMMRNVVLGLVLFVGAYSLISYIIPGGVFNQTAPPYTSHPQQPTQPAQPGHQPGQNPPSSGGPTEVSIATSNLYAPNSDAQKRIVVMKARSTGADIIGFQEAGGYDTTLGDATWRRIKGESGGVTQIAYKTDQVKLIQSATANLQPPVAHQPACGHVFENAVGATAGIFESRKTGQRFIVINTHLQQSAFQPGKQCLLPYWQAQAGRLFSFADGISSSNPSIIVGDLNRPQGFDWSIGNYTNNQVPATHGQAHYDRILTRNITRVSGVKTITTPSDHDTLDATVTFGRASK